MRQKIFYLLCFLLVVCIGTCLYTSFLGEPVDGIQLNVQVAETGDTLQVIFSPKEAGVQLALVQQELSGSARYIRVRKVSPPFGTIGTYQEELIFQKSAQDEVWLGGHLIWKK